MVFSVFCLLWHVWVEVTSEKREQYSFVQKRIPTEADPGQRHETSRTKQTACFLKRKEEKGSRICSSNDKKNLEKGNQKKTY